MTQKHVITLWHAGRPGGEPPGLLPAATVSGAGRSESSLSTENRRSGMSDGLDSFNFHLPASRWHLYTRQGRRAHGLFVPRSHGQPSQATQQRPRGLFQDAKKQAIYAFSYTKTRCGRLSAHYGRTSCTNPGFPFCLLRVPPLYTREPPSARNFVRRTIVQLQRPSPQPAPTWSPCFQGIGPRF